MKIADMHCDTMGGLWLAERDHKQKEFYSNDMHLDITKMQKGDYLLQNFAAFVFLHEGCNPLAEALEIIDIFRREMDKNRVYIAPVLSYSDIEKNMQAGLMSAMLTVEEGAVSCGSRGVLRMLYELGVRMMTLTWNFENDLAYPHTIVNSEGYDPAKRYGLKDAGLEIVDEMNRLGMIIDVSHLNDDGFWDVVKHSSAPFVASHSNSRAVCGHTRNLTDDMIRALADQGGVMGINFCGSFLTDSGDSTIDAMIRHVKHIIQVGGIGCVGLGTDFDGISGELEIKDGSYMPLLTEGLHDAGFSEDQIDSILFGNVLRVYKEVLH